MNKSLIVLCFAVLAGIVSTGSVQAQDSATSNWKTRAVFSANLSQAHFDNWSKGGESNVAFQAGVGIHANMTEEDFKWKNALKTKYGVTKVGEEDTKKSADEIKLESIFTYLLDGTINPFAGLEWSTQFTTGYEYLDTEPPTRLAVSNFMDPGYFIQNVGANWTPNEELSVRLSLSARQVVASEFTKYTDDPETEEIETTLTQFGFRLAADWEHNFHENIAYTSSFAMFNDFRELEESIVQWENVLVLSVTELLNANVNFDVYYDPQVSTRRQIREVLSIGLSYTIGQK